MEKLSYDDPQTPTEIDSVKKEARDIPLTEKEALVLLFSAALTAIMYAVCFDGVGILPQLSFTLFCPVTFLVLTVTLKVLGCFKNKKALLLAVPIAIISLYNGIFDVNFFTYSNVAVMHGLFAVYIICAMQRKPMEMFSMELLGKILQTVLGNWLIFIAVFKKISGKNASKSKSNTLKKVLLGGVISCPILFALALLLSSADMVFNKLATDFFLTFFESDLVNISFIITFAIAWIYAIGYVVQAKTIRDADVEQARSEHINADIIISATFLILINLLFLVFSVIQIAYLFNGGYMTLPEGMVYSQYAREGFFQLLLVTIINFSVIVVFVSVFKGATKSKLLQILLFMLCVFTGILIASSFYRMFLYIDVYGHTTLRLCVITFLVMEVFLILITVAKLFFEDVAFGKWLVTTCFIFYLIVNVTGSDYFATKLNIVRFLDGKQQAIDVSFVGADGLYQIEAYTANGLSIPLTNESSHSSSIESEYFSRSDNYPGNEQSLTRPKGYDHWQNWSYLKREGFR